MHSKIQRQMYLDFGQKSFNKSINCKKCLMTYIPSDADDFLRHKNHCINVQDCLCYIPVHYIEPADFTFIGEGPSILHNSKIVILRRHKLKSEFFNLLKSQFMNDGLNDQMIMSTLQDQKTDMACYLCIKEHLIHGCAFIETVSSLMILIVLLYVYLKIR